MTTSSTDPRDRMRPRNNGQVTVGMGSHLREAQTCFVQSLSGLLKISPNQIGQIPLHGIRDGYQMSHY